MLVSYTASILPSNKDRRRGMEAGSGEKKRRRSERNERKMKSTCNNGKNFLYLSDLKPDILCLVITEERTRETERERKKAQR